MEAQSLSSHQHSWWFSCFSLREKLARSHNRKNADSSAFFLGDITVVVNLQVVRIRMQQLLSFPMLCMQK